jgi:hypothetical protein
MAATAAQAQSPGGSVAPLLHSFATQEECRSSSTGEVVVCADRDGDRYRLPLPDEREPGGASAHVRGEIPRASAENPSAGGCGLFQGQRHCSKADALRYGYGGGADPLSFALKLGKALFDPDANLAPPPPLPQRFRREEPK